MAAVAQDSESSNIPQKPEEEIKEASNSPSNTPADIPVSPIQRHPLNTSWTLHYFLKDKNVSWEKSLIRVSTFDTVEDFWALMNHIEVPSRLKTGCDYNLFKTGIDPMWEDVQNREGGKWMFSVSRSQRQHLDHYFVELAMMLVGESEDEEVIDQINGIVVSNRNKQDKLAIWVKDPQGKACLRAGEAVKRCLQLPNNTLEFVNHRDSQSKSGSMARVSKRL